MISNPKVVITDYDYGDLEIHILSNHSYQAWSLYGFERLMIYR